MIRIRDIKLPVGHDKGAVIDAIAKIMCLDIIYPGNSYPDFSYEILRRSVDARKKPDIFFVYTVNVLISRKDEEHILKTLEKKQSSGRFKKIKEKILTDPVSEYEIPECGKEKLDCRPIVVGSGPAGLFAALLLARRGFRPHLVERGESVENRSRIVEEFWKTGMLDPGSNVQFGEGGAGTFSDGKLNTLTKDTNGRNTYVLRTFYEHGAPGDILTDAKPHIGTDMLKTVVANIRKDIISLGGEVSFNTKLTGIITDNGHVSAVELTDTKTGKKSVIKTNICVLCIGHSARDTFEMLYDLGTNMTQKSFAVGFRVIHPQAAVNRWQYGVEDAASIGLGPADYKVTNETEEKRRVYSFCMCPGGYVVNASSEDGRVCVNGMSEYKRDSAYANSAIVVAVDPDDFSQDTVEGNHPLAGMYYQRKIEEEAARRGRGCIPVQYFGDFVKGIASSDVTAMAPAVKGRFRPANLRGLFSEDIDKALIESMHKFGYTRKDFDADDTALCGIESRTSCPIRIERDNDLESNIKGLYPCGEGAGYAGGITSAASDGIRCAEQIIRRYHL